MGKVISFLNMKGGVCKTTLCKEIAYNLQLQNKKVLVIDIDPQSNCTQSFFEKFEKDVTDANGKIKSDIPSIQNLYDLKLVAGKEKDVILELTENLHLIPGDLTTVFMERNSNSTQEQKLLQVIKQWKLKENYDFIFIDCPPTYSFYTVSALMASDYYLVPSKADMYSLLGLSLLQDVVKKFITVDQPVVMEGRNLQCLGVILTMVEQTEGTKQRISDIQDYAKDEGIYIFENEFKYYNKLVTGQLATFIVDRNDSALSTFLENVSQEFLGRIEELNGKQAALQ
ncbi:ParA family protein [Bacillus thuringiensis]|uniref:ParA family protein n=1 Tax=Bacillus thuringiensis TaxID=1428 RepID=UPI000BF7D8AD|nr:AAA family ATPase [Bacillus thuringiensis]PFB77515.1 ATPase [Bacillus thuringiensis]PFJ57012.1 ATPase [Bacillus thuringiensis]